MGHNHTPARQPHPAEIVVALVLIVALLPVTLARRALARWKPGYSEPPTAIVAGGWR